MKLYLTESLPERTTARLEWEDSARPDKTLFVDFHPARSSTAAEIESGDADGWFLAAAFLADWTGERRLLTNTAVCPELIENTGDSLAMFSRWHGDVEEPLVLVPGKIRIHKLHCTGRAALLFSAGVDSIWTLYRNRSLYSEKDSRRQTVGLIVGGFEVHTPDQIGLAFRHGRIAAGLLELDLYEICTDIYSAFRKDDPHIDFLVSRFEGAFFAALAHMMKPIIDRVDIATTLPLSLMQPNGSHPMLRYSGEALQVRFDGLCASRLDKVRDLVSWPEAIGTLRVCNKVGKARAKRINCGECNKCIWTMLCIRAVGQVPPFPAFPGAALTPKEVQEHFTPRFAVQQAAAAELAEALDTVAEAALAAAVRERLAAFQSLHK